jgi:hypothetical protein
VLAERAAEFDADLAAELSRHTANDRLTETVSFAYELDRKPAGRVSRGPLRAWSVALPRHPC